ncbi:hypothetical protein JOF41_003615 [Saccharothrix coeruleofusca]|nr:hypothetical protein [Saccharothrix coeruleofusca]MBP2337437.1 hypothetical protein [Saccharothrix coeruleofusca]
MLDYRLFIEVDRNCHQVEKLVRERWHAWLRSKNYPADTLIPAGSGGRSI